VSDATPKTIGPYEVLRTLGKGGMGEVLLAYDPRLDRQVAIKRIRADITLDENRRRRFRREAQVAAGLNHPAIVHVFDLLTEDDTEHIVMEYVPGKALRSILKRGALTVREVIAMGLELAEGMAYAHRRGVVHRDLKTENVLVTPEGEPKITDFGIARRLLTNSPQEALTREGMVLGTYRAMSPEQIRGDEVDARSDLFSFGVLLYECLTGESPFLAESETATIARVLNQEVPPLQEVVPGVPGGLSALVVHLLQKDPHLRPRAGRETVDRFRALLPEIPDASGQATEMMTVVEGRPVETSASRDAPSSRISTPTSVRRRSGERRQVTLVGCDLVGLGAGSQTLDPERLYSVMPEFRALAREVMERWEGQIESLVGHRLVAYFGYPRAHEDDAWRAVRSALELVRRVEDVRHEMAGETEAGFALRAAVHTGLAVILPNPDVGETRGRTSSTGTGAEREEQVILGKTLDLTSGIQLLAEPGAVVVSSETHRLVEGYFATEALAATRVAGAEEPVTAHRITGERQVQSRLEAVRELSPLVARDRELGLLRDRWEMAREGQGQVVLIGGEAGIGKSRLLRSLREALHTEAPTWLSAYASPHARNTPLQPMMDLLSQAVGLAEADSPRERVERLEGLLLRHDLPPEEGVSLLAPFLDLPLEGDPAPEVPPERRRARTLELLLELILKVAERRPVILAVEDLHWVDPSTLDLLGLLIEQGASVSLLLLLTYRPDLEVPWGQHSHLTQLSLTRLAREESALLLRRLTRGKPLPSKVEKQILAKTEGVPLFVEELTRTLLDSGLLEEGEERWEVSAPLGSLDIPATLRDSLTARLDRLEEETREVAQYASVLGRRFTFPLLAAVVPLEQGVLRLALDRLVRAELLQRRGISWTEARYMFRHALIQDAAYELLLEGHRRGIHGRIADVLEEDFPEVAGAEPELLAHHHEQADRPEEAVAAWRRAGDRAAERYALVEAGHHYQHALELLERLPASTERSALELELRSALGSGLISTKGYGAEEVNVNFTRAWELCEELGDIPFPVRYGIWAVHLTRGDRERTDEMARWFEHYLETAEDGPARLMAANCLAVRAAFQGRFKATERYQQEIERLFDPEEHREVARAYGGSGGFYGYLVMVWVLLLTGRLERAVQHQRWILEQCEAMGEPYTLTVGWNFEFVTGFELRDPEWTRRAAERSVELAQEHSFPVQLVIGQCGLGWAQARLGEVEEGIARLRDALRNGWRAIGVRFLYPYYSAYLVEILLGEGRVADGLGTVEEALAVSRTTVDRFYEPELERLQGELLRRAGTPADEVEAIYRNALETVRKEDARLLELRLRTSLGHLLLDEGRGGEAVEGLGRILEHFEGERETEDVTSARELLSRLR
jgi:TOMM system kinase/cyclase fusion protein